MNRERNNPLVVNVDVFSQPVQGCFAGSICNSIHRPLFHITNTGDGGRNSDKFWQYAIGRGEEERIYSLEQSECSHRVRVIMIAGTLDRRL